HYARTGDRRRKSWQFRRHNRIGHQLGMATGDPVELRVALARLQRAHAIAQYAARLEAGQRIGDEGALQLDPVLDAPRAAPPDHFGVAAEGAGGRTGRIEQDAIEAGIRPEAGGIVEDHLRRVAEAGEIAAQPLQPRPAVVERADPVARLDELRRLAA